MKKLLSIMLVVLLLAGMAVTGTMAYLTSEDSDVNVMTLGNVKIAQHEYERKVENGEYVTGNVDNQTSYLLKDFTQGKALLPIVGDPSLAGNDPGYAGYDTTTVRMSQVDSYGGMQVFAGKNAQDKFVTVENTGKTDAYIRTLVAIEVGTADPDLISFSNHLTWEDNGIGIITIDGNNYYLHEFTYTGGKHLGGQHEKSILPAGDTSYPSLCQVYLKSEATNEDMEAIDGNGNGMLDILVLSQAVQTSGFADAETALNAGFGDITITNHPWLNTKTDAETATSGSLTLDSDYILTNKALYSNHKATESYTIDGKGHTVTGVATSVDVFTWEGSTIPAMSPIFSSENGAKVTVKDITFTGTMSAIMLGHYVNSSSNWYNTELNNVDVIGTEVVSFSAGISPAVAVYGKADLNNCNIYGTKLSALDTDPMWPVYDLAVVNYSDTTLNNSKVGSIYVWNQAKVTVAAGSEVDTMLIRGNMNPPKYGVTIKDGATVGTIDLSAITNKTKVNITIEDGATVGKIVANGVEYASIAAWQNA